MWIVKLQGVATDIEYEYHIDVSADTLAFEVEHKAYIMHQHALEGGCGKEQVRMHGRTEWHA
jgi:hypothetical protein